MEIVLASASPRRKRLLRKIVRKFSADAAKVDERMHAGESFPSAAMRLAEVKARKVARRKKDVIVIGADTIAHLGKRNFRKTENEKAARETLEFLSGKTHTVVTGVAVVFAEGKCIKYCEKAKVKMKNISGKMMESYLKSGEWKGRAGCYDVSGKGRKLVAGVKGEKETVIGLPLRRLKRVLAPCL